MFTMGIPLCPPNFTLEFFILFFFYLFEVGTGAQVPCWEQRTTCRSQFLSFHHVCSWDQTQVIGLGCKHLNLLSHLTGPEAFLWSIRFLGVHCLISKYLIWRFCRALSVIDVWFNFLGLESICVIRILFNLWILFLQVHARAMLLFHAILRRLYKVVAGWRVL